MDMTRVRIVQMNPETEVDFCVFPALWQAGLPARTTAVTGVPPNGGEGADLAILAGIWARSFCALLLKIISTGVKGQKAKTSH
jgi:hypothetical protein